MSTPQSILPGSIVRWQSGNTLKAKVGTVLGVIPAGQRADALFPMLERASNNQLKGQLESFIDRLLVVVPRSPMPGATLDYYLPDARWEFQVVSLPPAVEPQG